MQKEFPNQSLSFLGEASTPTVPLGKVSPLSLSLWERSGEGCHTALHTSYAVRVPSPSLPHRGRDYCEGCHTALHTSYAVRIPSPSLPHRGRDYCEGCHIIRLRRKIK